MLFNPRVAEAVTNVDMAIRRRRLAFDAWTASGDSDLRKLWIVAAEEVAALQVRAEVIAAEEVAKARAAITDATTDLEADAARVRYTQALRDEDAVKGR